MEAAAGDRSQSDAGPKKKILSGIARCKGSVKLTALEAALEARDFTAAFNAIPWGELEKLQFSVVAELESVLNKSGAAAAKALLPKGIKASFKQTNPESIAWVRTHAAELVTKNVIPTSQEAIRNIILRSFEQQDLTPAGAARLIREHVGILPNHTDAVEKYRQSLIAKFKAQGSVTWESDSSRLAMGYARKLVNYRAENIARTETIRACNKGQHALWRQAVSDDLLTPAEWERVWIASDPCGICIGLNNTRAPLEGPFRYGGKSYMMPPDPHPSCRCAVGLVRKE